MGYAATLLHNQKSGLHRILNPFPLCSTSANPVDSAHTLVYTPHQMSTIELVTNQTLAILTVATQVASILLFIGLFGTLKPLRHFVRTGVARFALWGAFALTAGAVVGSLLYS